MKHQNFFGFRFLLVLFLTIVFVASCSNEQNFEQLSIQSTDLFETPEVVPLEQAVTSLCDFLDEIGYFETKGGSAVFSSIETYKPLATKSDGLMNSLPIAYLINFGQNEGYAVLGANQSIPRIVAVVENGSISATQLMEFREQKYSDSILWDEIDDDFYAASGIDPNLRYIDIGLTPGGDDGGVGGGGSPRPTVSPLLNINWNQGNWHQETIYNKYCLQDGEYVWAGCSTAALAMILAHNARNSSQVLLPNSSISLDFRTIASSPINELTSIQKDYVSQLYGFLFNNLNHMFVCSEGTCITSSAIEQFINNHTQGYSNVNRLSASSFDYEMINALCSMLSNEKPVFVSAMSGTTNGHSWVIDGAKYASSGAYYSGDYLLHCNWGWSGSGNGYFSTNCFKPNDSHAELDNINCPSTVSNHYSGHFRMITYDFYPNSFGFR